MSTSEDRRAAGYEPRFDLDYEFGAQGELFAARLVDSLKNDRVEVKHDDKTCVTRNLYVEFEHDPGRRGRFVPSGIATTQCEWWMFVLDNPHTALVISTGLLRMLVSDPRVAQGHQERGSCPTRGYLLPIQWAVQASLDFARGKSQR